MERAFGPSRLRGPAAGCHSLLLLPDGSSEGAIAATAGAMGVRVNTLEQYRFASEDADAVPLSPALVLGFGNVDEDRIRHGIRSIAEAVKRHAAGPV